MDAAADGDLPLFIFDRLHYTQLPPIGNHSDGGWMT
jgi:hypothetical protein